jgi:hypothetical protein
MDPLSSARASKRVFRVWQLTKHEPRFLLAIFGLGFAFLPWSLLAVPRSKRWVASVVLSVAAIFSVLVTCAQALLPHARQPSTRLEFYDRTWKVDPAVAALPENESLLYNTGYTSSSYPGYYPLLGPLRTRIVIPVDTDASADSIVANMRRAHVRYVYVPASPENRPLVEAKFDESRFELVHASTIETPEANGTRRYLYRLKPLP